MAELEFDVLYKMILVGDSGVGKTNILTRYTKDLFSFDSKTTLGVELGSKIFKIKDHNIKLQIWDTAGQERYKSITCAYYKGAKGAAIVFDVARRETFNNVDKWHEDILKCGDKDVCLILIGNKCDLESRFVTTEEAKEKAKLLNCAYFETSAYKTINIDLAFTNMADQIFNLHSKREELLNDDDDIYNNLDHQVISINSKEPEKKKDECCI